MKFENEQMSIIQVIKEKHSIQQIVKYENLLAVFFKHHNTIQIYQFLDEKLKDFKNIRGHNGYITDACFNDMDTITTASDD